MKPLSLSAFSLRRNSASRVIARLRESRSLRTNLPLAILVASLATIFAVRYVLVRQHLDMGPDIANYLTTMNTLFGHDVTGAGLLRPPLIAIPLKLFTVVFGDLTGVKLLGVFISVAIGLPFYLIAKRISPPWIAVAVTILFVLTPAYADMLTWGYITMAGLLFTLLALYFFLLILESPSTQNILLAGLSSSLVVGLHQLSAAFFVPLLVSLITALVLLRRDQVRKSLMPLAAGVAIAVLLSVPYIPLYIRMFRMQSSGAGDPTATATPMVQFASEITDLPWLWAIIIGIVLALGALFSLWRHDKNTTILLAVLLVFPLALMLFTLHEPFSELNRRAHFFCYAPIWATAGFILSRLWSWRLTGLPRTGHFLPKLATIVTLSGLLISGVVVSQRAVGSGLDFYGYLDDTRWDAVQWIKSLTPEDATIAVYPAALEWWIEAEAHRSTLGVVDRNAEPYRFEREASLIADRLLSGNQGIENGSIRLSTGYPYEGIGLISAYVGGTYQNMLMLDSSQSRIQIEGQSALPISDASNQESVIYGDSNSMQIVTSCQIAGATITQTARLDQASQTAVVNYAIQSPDTAVARIDIPLLFCHQPKSVVYLDANRLQVVQEINTPSEGLVAVTTELTIDAEAATLETPNAHADRIPMSFQIQGGEARITLGFDVSTTQQPNGEQVVAYEVPQLIKDNAIGYLAIDLRPHSALWSDLPLGLEEWLNACPYYKLVYSEGDIRIYQVDTSALP